MMKKKGYAKGGMKKKGYAKGGAAKKRGMMMGGMPSAGKEKMNRGGLPMGKDPKTCKMIPKFAMDGKGKMAKGGMMKKKGYAKGGASRAKKK